MRQIIVDTETTGFYHDRDDRLLEFAGLEMIDRRLTGHYLHLFVDPQRDIPDEVVAVHGITAERLAEEQAQPFAAVGAQIADFLRGAELIIHNAPFDVGFLDMEFGRMGLPPVTAITANVVDTLKMAKERYPGQKNSLDALCTRLDVDRSRRVLHGALIDCELLAEVYLAMTRSQFSLVDELMDAAPAAAAHGAPSVAAGLDLPLRLATADELAAHEAYLDELERAAGGSCAWRQTTGAQG